MARYLKWSLFHINFILSLSIIFLSFWSISVLNGVSPSPSGNAPRGCGSLASKASFEEEEPKIITVYISFSFAFLVCFSLAPLSDYDIFSFTTEFSFSQHPTDLYSSSFPRQSTLVFVSLESPLFSNMPHISLQLRKVYQQDHSCLTPKNQDCLLYSFKVKLKFIIIPFSCFLVRLVTSCLSYFALSGSSSEDTPDDNATTDICTYLSTSNLELDTSPTSHLSSGSLWGHNQRSRYLHPHGKEDT